jgi:hypothetical protein
MEVADKKVCPQCDAVFKGEICTNCGYTFEDENSKTESAVGVVEKVALVEISNKKDGIIEKPESKKNIAKPLAQEITEENKKKITEQQIIIKNEDIEMQEEDNKNSILKNNAAETDKDDIKVSKYQSKEELSVETHEPKKNTDKTEIKEEKVEIKKEFTLHSAAKTKMIDVETDNKKVTFAEFIGGNSPVSENLPATADVEKDNKDMKQNIGTETYDNTTDKNPSLNGPKPEEPFVLSDTLAKSNPTDTKLTSINPENMLAENNEFTVSDEKPEPVSSITADVPSNMESVPQPVTSLSQENSTPPKDSMPQVQSIFLDIAKSSDSTVETIKVIKAAGRSKLLPIILVLILIIIAILSYWRFILLTPEFISPIVLSASDVKDISNGKEVEVAGKLDTNEKSLPFTMETPQGNFDQRYLEQFAPTETRLLIHAFDVNNAFDKFWDKEIYKELQAEYNFTENDMDVYLAKGFVLLYPEDDFSKWGFVVGVEEKSKAFLKERIEKFNVKKEDPKYELKGRYAELVEISETGKLTSVGKDTTLVLDEKDDKEEEKDTGTKEITDKNQKTEEDETVNQDEGEVAGESTVQLAQSNNTETPKRHFSAGSYLLVSNNKELLDQMKESAEGNLPNLGDSIEFSGTKLELPTIGQVLVYKKENSNIWNMFSDWAATKVDYVGLDKVLKQITSRGFASYSKEDKVIIKTSDK